LNKTALFAVISQAFGSTG